jgi:hypothetical protein
MNSGRVDASNHPARFSRFAAIDWSGAKGRKHPGIALAVAETGTDAPILITPPERHWSRTAVLDWILAQSGDMLIGFDFSFAPPFVTRGAYLPGDETADNARAFWAYVDHHCDDEDLGAASFLETRHRRHFYFGAADGSKADYMHLRACEAHYNHGGGGKPSSVYDVIGAAQVAKASFAGMRLLANLQGRVPLWPFDARPPGGPVILEIYTQIAARASGLRKGLSKVRTPEALDSALAAFDSAAHTPLQHYSDHATDALITAAWLRKSAEQPELWSPAPLSAKIAATEGWTFGVV